VKYSKQDIVNIVSNIEKEKLTKPELPLGSVVLDQPITELEVSKPYPKRVTAAEIVQMNPSSSSKPTDVKSPLAQEKPEKNNTPSEKEKKRSPDKSKQPKPEKTPHNGVSKEERDDASRLSATESKPSQT